MTAAKGSSASAPAPAASPPKSSTSMHDHDGKPSNMRVLALIALGISGVLLIGHAFFGSPASVIQPALGLALMAFGGKAGQKLIEAYLTRQGGGK